MSFQSYLFIEHEHFYKKSNFLAVLHLFPHSSSVFILALSSMFTSFLTLFFCQGLQLLS